MDGAAELVVYSVQIPTGADYGGPWGGKVSVGG